MDPVTALGAAAATSQFVGYGVNGLVNLIKLASQLRGAPSEIRELLHELQTSVSSLDRIRQDLQNPTSDLSKGLGTDQAQDIQDRLDEGHKATEQLCKIISALFTKKDGTAATGTSKVWGAVVATVKATDIKNRLDRIQRLYKQITLELQATMIELQLEHITNSAKSSDSIHDGLQQLSTQMASLHSKNQATNQKLDSICSSQHKAELHMSHILQMQPTLDTLNRGHHAMHQGIENLETRARTVDEILLTSRDLLMALTTQQHLALARKTVQISAEDKADIANQVATGLISSPSTLRDAFGKRPAARKARKYGFTIHLYPLLRKVLQVTFSATSGSGGYSLHHSLQVYATVKRSESPLFRLLDTKADVPGQRPFSLEVILRYEYAAGSLSRIELVKFLRDLLEDSRMALAKGGCRLTDRDEHGHTFFQEILSLFHGLDSTGVYLAEEFSPFGSFSILATRSYLRGYPYSYLIIAQELALASIVHHLPADRGLFTQFFSKLDSDEYLDPSLVNSIIGYDWRHEFIRFTAKRPETIELFSDSTGLGFALVHKLSRSLRGCYRKWEALGEHKDDPENSLGQGNSPLEFTIDWEEGLSILLDEGADPNDAISHAAKLGHKKALLFLLDVGHSKAVSACSILKGLKHLGYVSTETLSLLVHAVKLRRQMLLQLALDHLPETEHQRLGLSLDVILDSRAFAVYQALIEEGIEVPPALVVHDDKPLYHQDCMSRTFNPDVRPQDLFHENGFQEIDAVFECRTPYQRILGRERGEAHPRILLWFWSKGAELRGQTQLNQGLGPDSFRLALHFSDCYNFVEPVHFPRPLREDEGAIMSLSSIFDHCASKVTASIVDQCKCRCSIKGCTPVHFFRRAQRGGYSKDDPDIENEPPRRVRRSFTDDTLLIWTENAHLSNTEVRDAYEASCRLEIFERLGMAHTCFPHGVNPRHESAKPRSPSEIQALQEEDEEAGHHLELLMQAYTRCRSIELPGVPTARDYFQNLQRWWKELDQILPQIDYRRNYEDQIAESLERAGYLLDPSDEDNTNSQSPSFLSARIPDFRDVIQQHFSHYLTEDSSTSAPDTEDEWVTTDEEDSEV